MYQRIMLPLDGSDLAQAALPQIVTLCEQLDATLVLLHVRDARGSREAAHRHLDFVREHYVGTKIQTELIVRDGPVVAAILRAADDERIDLLAMATHGRSGIQRAVYGSVAEQVLHSSTKPVLLIRVASAPQEE